MKDQRTINEQIDRLKQELQLADAVVIGAGAGLSTSAGFVYDGERFARYFGDFAARYEYSDMYSGGFFPYPTAEERWGFWCRNIYINRFAPAPKDIYNKLFDLVCDKDYFVITTNVDHQFQKAGFDKERLFYTQGDYGLWQCSTPCHQKTYDNKSKVVKMVMAQGFTIGENAELIPPTDADGEIDFDRLSMTVPPDLIPYCPVCGEEMSMNLRADDTFVQDEGWQQAARRYEEYLQRHQSKKVLFLELGVGFNTPVIIKIPFIQMTAQWEHATYVCINQEAAYAPPEIAERSLCINADIAAAFSFQADLI